MSMNKGQEDILAFLQGPPWHAGLSLQTNHPWGISESIHLPCILLALLHFGKIWIKYKRNYSMFPTFLGAPFHNLQWGCLLPDLFFAVIAKESGVLHKWSQPFLPEGHNTIFLLIYLFVWFWLHWVFVAAQAFSSSDERKLFSSCDVWFSLFSLPWLLLLQRIGSRAWRLSSCGRRA